MTKIILTQPQINKINRLRTKIGLIQSEIALIESEDKHGSPSTYTEGCRCKRCKAAQAARVQARRIQRDEEFSYHLARARRRLEQEEKEDEDKEGGVGVREPREPIKPSDKDSISLEITHS